MPSRQAGSGSGDYADVDGWEVSETAPVGRHDGAVSCAGRGGDLEVMRSARAAGLAAVSDERCVVARDVEIERDYFETLEQSVKDRSAAFSSFGVGEFDTDEQLACGDRADHDVGISLK